MNHILKGITTMSVIILLASCGQQASNRQKLMAKSWELDMEAMVEHNKDDDKDNDVGAGEKLLGKLAMVFLKGLAQEVKFDFKSDGSFKAKAPLFSSKEEQLGKWHIEGDDLVLTFDGKSEKFPILKLTSEQLVLEGKGDEEDNNKGKDLYLKVSEE